jgi:hypothetical protein
VSAADKTSSSNAASSTARNKDRSGNQGQALQACLAADPGATQGSCSTAAAPALTAAPVPQHEAAGRSLAAPAEGRPVGNLVYR